MLVFGNRGGQGSHFVSSLINRHILHDQSGREVQLRVAFGIM